MGYSARTSRLTSTCCRHRRNLIPEWRGGRRGLSPHSIQCYVTAARLLVVSLSAALGGLPYSRLRDAAGELRIPAKLVTHRYRSRA